MNLLLNELIIDLLEKTNLKKHILYGGLQELKDVNSLIQDC